MFTAIRQHVLIPFHETAVRRRSIAKYRRFLEESQWWSRERLLEHQWQELGATAATCLRRGSFLARALRPHRHEAGGHPQLRRVSSTADH